MQSRSSIVSEQNFSFQLRFSSRVDQNFFRIIFIESFSYPCITLQVVRVQIEVRTNDLQEKYAHAVAKMKKT